MAETESISPGSVRLTITTDTGRTMSVGPFRRLDGARRYVEDLTVNPMVTCVQVEYRRAGTDWRPVWTVYPGMDGAR